MPPSVLIIDDEESVAWALRKACERDGYRAAVAATAEDGIAQAKRRPPDAVFLDVRLPGMDGLTALAKLKDVAPDAAVIVITAHGNLATAVKAVEGGAFDYLAKPFDLDQALDAVRRATASGGRKPPVGEKGEDKSEETGGLRPPLASDGELVGRSPAMQTVFKRIALVAPTDACVLVSGESGTGKELVARAVHANSPRRDKPFLPVHLAALNPNLVESELFGHTKGAFTGADRGRPGLLALADGGTVFLDELADIPLPVQAKLLRVLERQEALPVGGTEAQRVSVRVVSATHADLSAEVAAGRFRHDLFFRLNVYPIHLPALRDRADDIPLLAEHFLRRFADGSTLLAETIEYLKGRAWPGNVRELRNALEHAAIVARGGPPRPEHFPEPMALPPGQTVRDRLAAVVREWVREQARTAKATEPAGLYQALLDEAEPALVGEVLRQLDGNRLVAGRWLGLARATVRKMIRRHGLDDGNETDGE
ncbi:MAG TPA: sigma-54 dependent transcriptional regulator [Fimbriiglobus sp.]|nr:sigma-54 dependent transcriptional regulator [Fimbriiglobus sp.]